MNYRQWPMNTQYLRKVKEEKPQPIHDKLLQYDPMQHIMKKESHGNRKFTAAASRENFFNTSSPTRQRHQANTQAKLNTEKYIGQPDYISKEAMGMNVNNKYY